MLIAAKIVRIDPVGGSRGGRFEAKKTPLPDGRASSRFNQLTTRQPSAAIFSVRMVTTRAVLVANPRGGPPEQPGGDQPVPASVHSLVDATRKPSENADAVTLHYKAINEELEAQLAVALAQRDAWRELVEHCWRLVDAEHKRWFK